MKKKLFFLSAFLSLAIISNAQVSNGGFETWNTIDLFEGPANWTNSNGERTGTMNTQWSTDAQHLSHSVRLVTKDTLGDTTFGYVIQGEMGDGGPSKGVPYSGFIADTLIFWAKYDIKSMDSATILFVPFSLGSPVGMDVNKLYGSQSVWTRIAIGLQATPVAPDEVLLAFASSDALNDFGIDSSWFMVDNIQIKDTSGAIFLIDNYSFETWDTTRIEEPLDWYSTNLFRDGDTLVYKTGIASTGSFAAELNTKDFDGDTVRGELSNGPAMDWWFDKVPYTDQPTSLDFDYQYYPSGSDSGYVSVEFFASGSTIGGAFYNFNSLVTSYTTNNLPISLFSAPDSMRIVFNAGNHPGSQLFVDNVALTGGTVGIENIAKLRNFVTHYPNPVVNELTIQTAYTNFANHNVTIQIIDLNGKIVYSGSINSSLSTINVNGLPKGTYTYSINFGKEVISNKFIKL